MQRSGSTIKPVLRGWRETIESTGVIVDYVSGFNHLGNPDSAQQSKGRRGEVELDSCLVSIEIRCYFYHQVLEQ